MSTWDDAKKALAKAIAGRFDVNDWHEADKRAFIYMSHLKDQGFSIVPTSSLPTDAQCAVDVADVRAVLNGINGEWEFLSAKGRKSADAVIQRLRQAIG